MVAGRDRYGGFDDLLDHADPVVDVLQLAVFDVEGMAAESGAVREQHAGRLCGGDGDLDCDGVGAVAEVRCDRFGDLGAAGVVDVALAWVGRSAVVRWRGSPRRRGSPAAGRLILTSLGTPQRDEFLQLVRVLVGRRHGIRWGRDSCRRVPTAGSGSPPTRPVLTATKRRLSSRRTRSRGVPPIE